MALQPPSNDPSHPRRQREAQDVFRQALRRVVIEAVEAGWREAEAALALADAADDYVLYLSDRPRRRLVAANGN
jgi:hypothetical protein